jgi:hypothetical protein
MLTLLTFKGVADIVEISILIGMLLQQEKCALMLLIGVTAALICGFVLLEIAGKEPFSSPYTPGSPDGAPVVYEGWVTGYSVTKSGGNLILDVEGVTVFIPSQLAGEIQAKKGDHIRVIGIVQTYQSKKEILVEDPTDLIIQ